jgi:histidinol-phosphate aminotransferase
MVSAAIPEPRPEVADGGLTRPDWTTPVERDPSLLWLDKNENGDPEMVALVAGMLGDLGPEVVSTYPEMTALYRLLADHVRVHPAMLVITGGADGGIRSVYDVFVRPGDVVMRVEPTYAMYDVYGRMYGARQVVADYEASTTGPRLDVGQLLESVAEHAPRLVCLPNPASPTGEVLSLEVLERVAVAVGDQGGVLVVDEAYHPYDPVTAVPLIEHCSNVIAIRTFSKAWGLAGLRIGYCVGAPAMVALLHKVRPGYETNFAAVRMAERLLAEDGAMYRSVRRLNDGRDGFLRAMDDFGFRTAPSGGNFLLVSFGDLSPEVHEALADLVLYRKDFEHPSLAGFSRFSATTAERFVPVVERIRQVVARDLA